MPRLYHLHQKLSHRGHPVRSGKATILPNRCIDCGTCIRVCPHKAVKSVCDDFSALKNYRYTIAIPDPALYGQFQNLGRCGHRPQRPAGAGL